LSLGQRRRRILRLATEYHPLDDRDPSPFFRKGGAILPFFCGLEPPPEPMGPFPPRREKRRTFTPSRGRHCLSSEGQMERMWFPLFFLFCRVFPNRGVPTKKNHVVPRKFPAVRFSFLPFGEEQVFFFFSYSTSDLSLLLCTERKTTPRNRKCLAGIDTPLFFRRKGLLPPRSV